MCELQPGRTTSGEKISFNSDGVFLPQAVRLGPTTRAVRWLCVLECDHGKGWQIVPWPKPGEVLTCEERTWLRLRARTSIKAWMYERLPRRFKHPR